MKFTVVRSYKILPISSCFNLLSTPVHVIFFLWLNFFSFFLVLEAVYTNEFAVKVNGGEENARQLAEQHGFLFRGQIGSLNGYYLFENHRIQKRSTEPSVEHHELLKSDPAISWIEQQQAKHRVKRDIEEQFSQLEYPDPLYPEQWFLIGGGNEGYDMNVRPAWSEGYTGKGVVVSILDDGIQTNHPDLAQNYDKMASLDINGHDDDPTPQDNGDNKHGTRCAGEVAAVAYNEFCGVGVAYNASIGGVRMLDGTVTDVTEAVALGHNPDHIDIYSASWGPEDDGKTVDGPGTLAKLAFSDGIEKGRSGLGSIFVWASGNGGRHFDSCNCDGYTNSIYTLSISSATQAGTMPWYLEQCSSTLATTYSSGTAQKDKSIATVDMDNSYFYDIENNRTPNPASLCTKSHTGTSASAPIAAGICALALEANRKLTWRDMQHIVLMTSRPEPLMNVNGWVRNGVGRLVSSKFGYGLMNAAAMVKLALQWTTVPPQHKCETATDRNVREIPSNSGGQLEINMNASNCKNSKNVVTFLEHVLVNVTLYFKPRGNLKIVLVSPAGTPSTVLLPRVYDVNEGSFNNWPFMSVHFWGENPVGLWTLIIKNSGENKSNEPGKLIQWSLVFYGTETQPVNLKQAKRDEHRSSETINDRSPENVAKLPDNSDSNLMEECLKIKSQLKTHDSVDCLEKCPDGTYHDLKEHICRSCDKSCMGCYGPSSDNCLSCPEKLFLSKNTCGKSCHIGFYADVHKKECLPCLVTCSSCQSSRDYCISCKSNWFLLKNSCVAACPSGMFQHQSSNICKKCHPSCASCFSMLENECLTCSHSKLLLNGACVSDCPDGFFVNEYRQCVRCHRSCKKCSDAFRCIECNQNWKPDESGLCVWMSECKKGWYSYSSKSCEHCFEGCAICNGSQAIIDSSIFNGYCYSCEKGYYLSENTCVEACPQGSFVNVGECFNCSYFCKKCLNHGNYQCLSCQDPLVLHSGNCIVKCPIGFYANNERICQKCDLSCQECYEGTKYHCTSCHSNRYFFNNTCRTSCPLGYFVDEQTSSCMPCYHLCKTCTEFGPWNCTRCNEQSSFNSGICIPCLDDEYFDATSKKCQRCHDKCGRCNGSTEFNCLSCQAPLRLDELNKTCLPCCNGKVIPDNYKCCTCSPDLDICINSVDRTRSIGDITYDPEDLSEVGIPLNHVVPIIIAICALAILLFVIIFGILLAKSAGWCQYSHQRTLYKKIPNSLARFDSEMETLSLTQEDTDEEDDIHEKA